MADQKQESLPVLPWMRNPVNLSLIPECPFEQLPGLDPRLQNALQKMGFAALFPIQFAVWLETIGPGAFDRDLCINSPTGSGKTLAYALPIVQMLSTRVVRCLRALVVVPTRDLALQVKEVFSAIAPAVGLSVGLAIGQTSIANEVSELMKTPKLEAGICYDPEDNDHTVGFQSSVDILVATPGRLMDHINTTKGFTLEHLRYLVVDETDRLLRESYQSWLPTVLQLTQNDEQDIFSYSAFGSLKTIRKSGVERGFKDKTSPRLVKMVLSATLTRDPSKLSQLELHHPLFLTTRRYMLPEKLESYKLICESKDKLLYLVALLQELKGEKCIVFTSSTQSTDRLNTFLKLFGGLSFKFKKYSGLLHQSERNKTIVAFRKGKVQVLIASDAMTRGMDIQGVSMVVNYDMPAYTKTYVHRAGRTARAMEGGRCFTLMQNHEQKRFNKLLNKADHSASVYTLPANSIEALRPQYALAVDKLNSYVKSGTIKAGQGKV